MVKLLGACCIFGGGAYVRWTQIREVRRELDTLSELGAALEQMIQEIRLARTPLPALLEGLGRRRSGDTAAFFQTAAEALRQGVPAGEAWRSAAEDLPLSREDRTAVAEAGNSLQGDEAQICKAISLVGMRLTEHLTERHRSRPEREKRATALTFSAAALLVILLI